MLPARMTADEASRPCSKACRHHGVRVTVEVTVPAAVFVFVMGPCTGQCRLRLLFASRLVCRLMGGVAGGQLPLLLSRSSECISLSVYSSLASCAALSPVKSCGADLF